MEFSRDGYKIRKNQHSQRSWINGCPKLGISLENRIISKFMVSKNVLLNSYFSIKKKWGRFPMIFDIENWLWKSNFVTFRKLPITRLFGTKETWRMKQTQRQIRVFNENPPYSFIWTYSFNWHLRVVGFVYKNFNGVDLNLVTSTTWHILFERNLMLGSSHLTLYKMFEWWF